MLVLIIVVFSISSCCSATIHTNSNSSRDLFILSQFLELQSEFCGYVQLCTIDRWINFTFTIYKQPCCRPCSCEDSCEHTGTCCPDAWLSHLRNTNIALPSTIINQTELIKQRNNSSLEIKDDNFSTCVSPMLHSRHRLYGYQGADEGFLMISFCPNSFKNSEIKENCEGAKQLKTTSKNTLIPVTSIETGRTYRNLFCLECNEGHTREFIHWENWLSCSHKNVEQRSITSPDNVFTNVVLHRSTYCNIVYRPPSVVNITASTCKQADITSCPDSETNGTNTTTTTTMLIYKQMCRQFYLPVFDYEGFSFTIYKNIACYLCNNGTTLPKYCPNTYFMLNEYNLQINIKHLTSNKTVGHALSHLDISFDDICGVGYVFDEVMKHCRMVFCPRLFYIYNGSCEPMITIVQGVHYKLMLEVTPEMLITSQYYQEYENNIASIFSREIKNTFSEFHIDFWRIAENQALLSNIACLKFRNENKTYADTILELQKFLDKISFLRNNSLKLSAQVTLAVNMEEVRQIKQLPLLIVKNTGKEAVPARVSRNIRLDGAELELSKAHICNRLELKVHEFTRVGKQALKVIRTGALIEGVNYDLTETGRELACITDVMLTQSGSTGHNLIENVYAGREKQPPVVLITFGSLIAFVVLIAAVRFIINCIRRDDTVQ